MIFLGSVREFELKHLPSREACSSLDNCINKKIDEETKTQINISQNRYNEIGLRHENMLRVLG